LIASERAILIAPTNPFTLVETRVSAMNLAIEGIPTTSRMAGGWGEISGNVTNGFTATVYFKEPDKTATVLDANCRAAALNLATDTNVRCFNTVFVP